MQVKELGTQVVVYIVDPLTEAIKAAVRAGSASEALTPEDRVRNLTDAMETVEQVRAKLLNLLSDPSGIEKDA